MVQADPQKLGVPIPWELQDRQLHLLVVDLHGKIVGDLGKEPGAIANAVISPGGKYVMYKANSGQGTYVRICSIDPANNSAMQENKPIPTSAIPLCITDEGLSATCQWKIEAIRNGGSPPKMKLDFVITGRDTNRHSWRLLSGKPIVSAAGVGDLLYYVEMTKNGVGKLFHKPLNVLVESRGF